MEVSRLYPISRELFSIERLWSKITVFCEIETATGRKATLHRLKKLRDDLDKVVKELEAEQEMEAWLE